MKKYRVSFHYEQGSVLEVEAENAEAAEEAVLEWVASEACLSDPTLSEQVRLRLGDNLDVVHHDYLVCDIDEE